jgi:hypothetical protein
VTEIEGVSKLCMAYAVAAINLDKESCILQHHGMPNRIPEYLDKHRIVFPTRIPLTV